MTKGLAAAVGLALALPALVSAAPRELRQQTGFVTSDGAQIYWESTGTGSETVVLTHGLGGNHAVWFQQVPALAQRYRVVTWDMRGFGRSTLPATTSGEGLSFAALADDLLRVLDHLEIEHAHLIGQSLGGWTTLQFGLRHPERARSLVLADTPGGISSPELVAVFDRLARAGQTPQNVAALPITRHPALGTRLGVSEPERAFLYRQIASLAAPPPVVFSVLMRDTVVGDLELARLALPVLFLVGAEDDIFPPALIEAAAKRVGGAQLAVIPKAGHSPYFERPEAFNREVLRFLDRVAAANATGS